MLLTATAVPTATDLPAPPRARHSKEHVSRRERRAQREARDPRPHPFRAWRRGRPFVGGVLLVLSGVMLFLSTQLELGAIKLQMGIEGFQAVVIPAGLILLGVLAILMPAHHIFYGIIALVAAIYSIIGVNLGGFFVGMLLGAVGGVLVVAWARPEPRTAVEPAAGEQNAMTAEYVATGSVSQPAAPAAPAAPVAPLARDDKGPIPHAEFVPVPSREGVGR